MCCFHGCFLIIGERDKSVVCALECMLYSLRKVGRNSFSEEGCQWLLIFHCELYPRCFFSPSTGVGQSIPLFKLERGALIKGLNDVTDLWWLIRNRSSGVFCMSSFTLSLQIHSCLPIRVAFSQEKNNCACIYTHIHPTGKCTYIENEEESVKAL